MGKLLPLYLLIYLFLSLFILSRTVLATSGTINVSAKVALSDYWANRISKDSLMTLSPTLSSLNEPTFINIKLQGLGKLIMSNRKLLVRVTLNNQSWADYHITTGSNGSAGVSFVPDRQGIYRISASYLDPDKTVNLGQNQVVRISGSFNQSNFKLAMTLLNNLLISTESPPVREKL